MKLLQRKAYYLAGPVVALNAHFYLIIDYASVFSDHRGYRARYLLFNHPEIYVGTDDR